MTSFRYAQQKPACPGFGLGLRPDYYDEILDTRPDLDWFEITTENYLVPGGKPLYYLDKIREHYPMVLHGVSLSLGGSDPLDQDYLQQLQRLVQRVQPLWVSDHLCWTGINQLNLHDLLPLPYTEEAIRHVVARIVHVQDYLGQRIAIENVSSYLTFAQSEMSEWDFINEIVKRADCYLLLDVNNVYVSAMNHGFCATDYIKAMPGERIVQIHLAGHSCYGDYIIDTHDAAVIEPVWDLYAETIRQFGKIATMIERDDNMPPLSDLLAEVQRARRIVQTLCAEVAA